MVCMYVCMYGGVGDDAEGEPQCNGVGCDWREG
jgi:hypothetical protein